MRRDPPPLTTRQQLAQRAFHDLIGERALSAEVMGPIYWRAIAAWVDRYGIQEAESFIELVQAIDRDYLSAETTSNRPHRNPKDAKGRVAHGT